MRVYKFLNENFGVSNLALRRIKVSTFDTLNDPFEFLAADLIDPRHLKAFKKLKQELGKNKGMVSFSKSWSNPLLWGHYADSHKGLALGFEIPEDLLVAVLYRSNRTRIKFDTTQHKVVDGMNVVDQIIRTKFTDWQYEEEYRLFCKLGETETQGGLHFVSFSEDIKLEQVILGMNSTIPIDKIRQLVGNQLSPNRIIRAGMHRRQFKVIEDRLHRSH